MSDHDRTSHRIALVIDLDGITENDAYWLARTRLREAISAIDRAGYRAAGVRVDINGCPHLQP